MTSWKTTHNKSDFSTHSLLQNLVIIPHSDHTGELRMLPNAKIYISEKEADSMKLTGDNVIRVKFTDETFKKV